MNRKLSSDRLIALGDSNQGNLHHGSSTRFNSPNWTPARRPSRVKPIQLDQSAASNPNFEIICFRGNFNRDKESKLHLFHSGLFTDEIDMISIDPRASEKIVVGRYEMGTGVKNDIEFQDNTVASFAAEIIFKKNAGFCLRCLNPTGAHVVYTSQLGTPVAEQASLNELVEIPHCSAIRFGVNSWVSAAPFIATILLLCGVYDNMEISAILTNSYSVIGSGVKSEACILGKNVEDAHCCVIKTRSGFLLKDLSHEVGGVGTFINGVEVYPPSGVILFPGAQISLGLHGPMFTVKAHDFSKAPRPKRRNSRFPD